MFETYWIDHGHIKITVLGVEIRIGRDTEFEGGGEESKMAVDELVLDLSRWFSICTDFLTVKWCKMQVLFFGDFSEREKIHK